MDPDELPARLEAFGLDQSEALLYFHLSRLGPSLANDLAHAAGKSRTDTYRVLDNLVHKEFAQKSLERPVRYIPLDLEDALARALARRRAQDARIQQEVPDLVARWPRPTAASAAGSQRFSVHQGAAQIEGLERRMFEAAREDIVVVTNARGLQGMGRGGLLEQLQARARSGVLVRLLMNVTAGDRPVLDALAPDLTIRHTQMATSQQVVLVDANEMALWIAGGKAMGGTGEECVLWLNAPETVLGHKRLIDMAWSDAVAYPARGRELDGAGPAPQVAVLRGRWVRYQRMRDMACRALGRIEVTGPPDEVARWARCGFNATVERRRKEGIAVSVREGPQTCLVVDGREALFVLQRPGAHDGLTDEEERSLWSTDPALLALLRPDATGLLPLGPLT